MSVCEQSSRSVALIIWLMSFLIGVYVALIAFCVTLLIKHLTRLKFAAIYARILNGLAGYVQRSPSEPYNI